MTNRRDFIRQGSALILSPYLSFSSKELRCDVAVIGGGLGGVASALAACRNGRHVILTEETDWIGGQVSSQAVPPDEHAWIEQFGCTRSYRHYRNAVRDYYRRNYPLTEDAASRWNLNPGDGNVSRLTHEPKVSVAVLEAMLAPYLASGRLELMLKCRPVAADIEKDRVQSVTVKSLESGLDHQISAAYFLDATETGELLPLTKTEYVTGAESRKQTGELHAPSTAQPLNMQAVTWCFAMDHRPGENRLIDKPDQWAYWRDHVPTINPPWPGKLLSWEQPHPQNMKQREVFFDPELTAPPPSGMNFHLYRRIINRRNFTPGTFSSDITIVNWPMNDYFGGPVFEVPEDQIKRHLYQAKQLSLSLLYWLQTEAPRPDGGQGWKGLRLRGDIVGNTPDGLAKYPYIRESRRIQAEFTVLEQHVGTEARSILTGRKPDEVTAETFRDSVGIGSYRIDLHMSTGGDNYIDVSSLPFQIPLGALIPKRVRNLIPACKNIGTTHITNGCYRLHPVEWNIGEAAGALASHALQTGETPHTIRNTATMLADFQAKLQQQGVELNWPRLTPR